ncbi:LapA family protein [Rhizobium sp. C1]|uniref:LapA family protein n=1 Tax=Rhizobium sp. C1 TaxID=1349799 RepID=UPI001E29DBFE|nr:LapA family protein [Rhizobium sp. C1]MCD2179858.1 LapA family protein [Rhizobium sp. C1]
MTKKLINLVILLPIAIILIVLSVANRHAVTLSLNPFEPSDPVLSLTAPFFVYLFLAVILGALIGSSLTWFSQGKHRKQARRQTQEAARWQGEARRNQKRAEELAQQVLLPVSASK